MNRIVTRSALHLFFCCLGFFAMPAMLAQAPAANVSTEKELPMAADANPSFMVAVIKPSEPDATGGWSFESEGHRLQCKNATVLDILSVAYGVQTRQITCGPAWLSKDRYDISGIPDVPGVPSTDQLRGMYQKLLAERFHLVLHREMRDMPVYALTVAKDGPKLKPAGPDEPVNAANSGNGNARTTRFTNMSMREFAHNLDIYEDRPVIDETALKGRYDFTLRWAPDLSTEGQPDAPPSLFTAVREQLGLRLSATRGAAEVIVIDSVEMPSAN